MVQQQIPTSTPYLSQGHVVAGRYKILRTLGAGGMASVYLAEDLVLGETTVALKILKRSEQLADSAAERFLREVRLTHKINHENVVRTFDFGQDGDLRFYTMEYLSGKTLSSFMEDVLPISSILKIAVQIARGISAIHSVGVVHRDLKPDNIMVVDALRVKITDFGVARTDVSKLTGGAEQILGTISYMAPETLVGEKVSPAVDFYSFGAIIYELLTGHLPIEDSIPALLIMRKVDERPSDPRTYRDDIPSWLADGVMDLLNPNPVERMKSVRAFFQNLTSNTPNGGVVDLVTAAVDINVSDEQTAVFKRSTIIGSISKIKSRRFSLREYTLATILSLCAAWANFSTLGVKTEIYNLDRLFNLRGAITPSPDVVVVAIDEQSYLNLNIPMATAWPRKLHTKLIERLKAAGARRVVFDMLFVNSSIDAAADQEFASAIGTIPTILGASVGYSQQATLNGSFLLEQVIRPAAIFEKRAEDIGIVGLPQGEGGRILNFLTERSALFPEGRPLSEVAIGGVGSYTAPDERYLINYYGPVPAIKRYSYHDVIADEARIPSEAFNDRIVFVGLTLQSRTGPSQREAFTTPFDAGMFGTEIHATATSNILNREWISRYPFTVEVAVVAATAFLATLVSCIFGGLAGLLAPLGLFMGSMIGQYGLFLVGVFVPVITPVALGFIAGLVIRIIVAPGASGGWRRGY